MKKALLIFLLLPLLSSAQLKLKLTDMGVFKTLEGESFTTIGDSILIKFCIGDSWQAIYKGKTGFINEASLPQTEEFLEYKKKYGPKPLTDAQRKAALIKKYGTLYGNDIYKGVIRMGMTTRMVTEVLGEPDDVNRTVTRYSVSEQWVYDKNGDKMEMYYFENGKLTSWQD